MLVSYRSGDMVAPALPETRGAGPMVGEFAAAIRSGEPPLTDGRAGLRVLRDPRGGLAQPRPSGGAASIAAARSRR